jgi:hypothetical protein
MSFDVRVALSPNPSPASGGGGAFLSEAKKTGKGFAPREWRKRFEQRELENYPLLRAGFATRGRPGHIDLHAFAWPGGSSGNRANRLNNAALASDDAALFARSAVNDVIVAHGFDAHGFGVVNHFAGEVFDEFFGHGG